MKPRVLYVDDDQSNLMALTYALGDLFEFTTTESGARALELVRRESFDAILVDQRMPGMTGVELCRQLQKLSTAPRLMFTAYVDARAATDAINMGRICRLLFKPHPPDGVRNALYKAIREAREEEIVGDLRTTLLDDVVDRAASAATFKAARDETNVSPELWDLLFEGANASDPCWDDVRVADTALEHFMASVSGSGGMVYEECLANVTAVALETIGSLLPHHLSVLLVSSTSPRVCLRPEVFAHCLFVLLNDANHAEILVRHDETGVGWLDVDVAPGERDFRLASALAGVCGGRVERTNESNGVTLRFATWAVEDPPPPRSNPIRTTFWGQRISNNNADILFVDDDASNRALFVDAFSDFRVAVAESAAEALELISTLGPYVLVTDERKPETNGSELCAAVGRLHPQVVRVVLTAHGDFALAQRLAGKVRYLVHAPYSANPVQSLLRDCVQTGKAARLQASEGLELLTTQSLLVFEKQSRIHGERLLACVDALRTAGANVSAEAGTKVAKIVAPLEATARDLLGRVREAAN